MSSKAVAWTLLAVVALAIVLLFNYWADYQLLSTLVYVGIVLAICGLANLVLPFRFLGVQKRAVGALILASGMVLALTALSWPASTIRVAQPRSRLDDIMPQYQFFERHSKRVHARPEQLMQAVRQSTFGDLKSLATLLRIRAAALRLPDKSASFQNMRVLDAFAMSGYVSDNGAHEIVMAGGANALEKRPLKPRSPQEFAADQQPGTVKIAFNFTAEDVGGGWSIVSTETRIFASDDSTRRGMARYWRLIVPGSGLLRRQWLNGIKTRAESMTSPQT